MGVPGGVSSIGGGLGLLTRFLGTAAASDVDLYRISCKSSICWYLYYTQFNPVIHDVGGLLVGEISQGVRPCLWLSV